MNTKKCRFCQSEIDNNAKRCAQCQADLRHWFARHPILTFIIAFFLIGSTMTAYNSISEVSVTNESGQQVDAFETVSIDSKVTESNSIWTRYSWVLVMRNNTDRNRTMNPTIKWLDEDGFVLDQVTEYGLSLPANQESTFNGFQLIDASSAGNISAVEVEF